MSGIIIMAVGVTHTRYLPIIHMEKDPIEYGELKTKSGNVCESGFR